MLSFPNCLGLCRSQTVFWLIHMNWQLRRNVRDGKRTLGPSPVLDCRAPHRLDPAQRKRAASHNSSGGSGSDKGFGSSSSEKSGAMRGAEEAVCPEAARGPKIGRVGWQKLFCGKIKYVHSNGRRQQRWAWLPTKGPQILWQFMSCPLPQLPVACQ